MKPILNTIAMVILFYGCSKDCDPGAPGSQGPQGAEGNANVRSSTFSVLATQWITSGFPGTSYQKDCEVLVPEITQSIIEKGSVSLYLRKDSSDYQMPFSVPTSSTILNYQYQTKIGSIKITLFYNSFSSFIVQDMMFKVVTIEGS